MRVVSTELRKLFSSKMFLLIIAAVFVLNGYLMVRTANSGNAKPSDYKEVYSEMEGLSDIEKLDWLDERIQEYSGQHSYNFEVLHELHEECYNVVHYKDYIDNIDAQAKSMTSISIFAKKGTFNYRNIQNEFCYQLHTFRTKKLYQKEHSGVLRVWDNHFAVVDNPLC